MEKNEQEAKERKTIDEQNKAKGIEELDSPGKRKRRLTKADIEAEEARKREEDRSRLEKMAELEANSCIRFDKQPPRGPLVMGKQKKTLDTALDFSEKKKLHAAIAEETKSYMKEV